MGISFFNTFIFLTLATRTQSVYQFRTNRLSTLIQKAPNLRYRPYDAEDSVVAQSIAGWRQRSGDVSPP